MYNPINGPNLNLLGSREIDVYGKFTLDDVYNRLVEITGKNHEIIAFQSNNEGELINYIQLSQEKQAKVVQEAPEMIVSSPVNTLSFTLNTIVLRSPAAGAEITTFLAPASI